jgi:hypothetical protein
VGVPQGGRRPPYELRCGVGTCGCVPPGGVGYCLPACWCARVLAWHHQPTFFLHPDVAVSLVGGKFTLECGFVQSMKSMYASGPCSAIQAASRFGSPPPPLHYIDIITTMYRHQPAAGACQASQGMHIQGTPSSSTAHQPSSAHQQHMMLPPVSRNAMLPSQCRQVCVVLGQCHSGATPPPSILVPSQPLSDNPQRDAPSPPGRHDQASSNHGCRPPSCPPPPVHAHAVYREAPPFAVGSQLRCCHW